MTRLSIQEAALIAAAGSKEERTCGEAHGKMCEKVEAHEKEIKEQLWPTIRTRLAARTFFWTLTGFGAILLIIIGWVGASSSKIFEVDRSMAVLQTDVGHIKQSVERIDHALNGKKGNRP